MGKSRWLSALTIHLPIPGHEKTVSVIMLPPKSPASIKPAIVVTGIKALRKVCTKITLKELHP